MGLPNDTQRDQVWVDSYAYEFSRDMEPTVEGGSFIWQMMTSCISLYKSGQTCTDQPKELCCISSGIDVFTNIWSLKNKDGDDFMLTDNSVEKTQLIKQGWKEICHSIQGPTDFCVDTEMTDGRQGPFIIYKTQ